MYTVTGLKLYIKGFVIFYILSLRALAAMVNGSKKRQQRQAKREWEKERRARGRERERREKRKGGNRT